MESEVIVVNPMEPVVFLDIDGVLNSDSWRCSPDRGRLPPKYAKVPRLWWDLNPALIRRLNRLTAGKAVVVMSTWRFLYDWNPLKEALQERGLQGRLVGITPDLACLEKPPLWVPAQRGAEVLAWRKEQGHVGPFVCLDDAEAFDDCADHLVRTSGETGITEADVDKALAILEVS
jgi:hypothetical protein